MSCHLVNSFNIHLLNCNYTRILLTELLSNKSWYRLATWPNWVTIGIILIQKINYSFKNKLHWVIRRLVRQKPELLHQFRHHWDSFQISVMYAQPSSQIAWAFRIHVWKQQIWFSFAKSDCHAAFTNKTQICYTCTSLPLATILARVLAFSDLLSKNLFYNGRYIMHTLCATFQV